jgi:hypothetical protein
MSRSLRLTPLITVDLDANVIAVGGVIGSYYSSADRPALPYRKLGFADDSAAARR